MEKILIQNIAAKSEPCKNVVQILDSGSNTESNNLLDICRICMVHDENMINLWSPPAADFDEEFEHIKDILTKFASVLIDENDHLPGVICGRCEANIYLAYTFKRKCENSVEILKNVIKYKNEQKISGEALANGTQLEGYISLEETLNPIEISYPCDQCSEAFEQRLQLSQHIKKFHTRYKCNDCGEDFAQPQIVRRHRKIHLGIKNKVCPLYFKPFLRSDDLTRHIRIHTGEKPFKCDQCPKTYKQSSELKQHILTHSDVKQFTCNLCDKSMSTRNGYYIHMKVHKGQKDHKCNMCDKKFVTSSERTSHILYIHLKEKRFICTIPECSKGFVTKISLNKHLKMHERKMKSIDEISKTDNITNILLTDQDA